MVRVLLKVVLAAAALAAVWSFVPIRGHTMADRWHRARTPAEFVDRTWAEVRGEGHAPPAHPHAPPARSPGQGPSQARAGAPAARPTESHTDADRKALDRILSQHVGE